MAYVEITPVTSMPADGAAGKELAGFDACEVSLDCSAGTGTACLIKKGPGGTGGAGKWRQYGPSWTVDNTTAGQQVPRFKIPRDKAEYGVLITGGPTIDACYLEGTGHGR